MILCYFTVALSPKPSLAPSVSPVSHCCLCFTSSSSRYWCMERGTDNLPSFFSAVPCNVLGPAGDNLWLAHPKRPFYGDSERMYWFLFTWVQICSSWSNLEAAAELVGQILPPALHPSIWAQVQSPCSTWSREVAWNGLGRSGGGNTLRCRNPISKVPSYRETVSLPGSCNTFKNKAGERERRSKLGKEGNSMGGPRSPLGQEDTVTHTWWAVWDAW